MPDNRRRSEDQAPWLSAHATEAIRSVLLEAGLLEADQPIDQVTVAGQGNMNLTLRVKFGHDSVIVKQSRPWVEKYPTIAAPVDRALFEMNFYEATAQVDTVSTRMPRLLGRNAERYVLILEDLGESADCSNWYALSDASREVNSAISELVAWLAALHTIQPADPAPFRNLALRQLNHDHMFTIPFDEPPMLDLDQILPGLESVARPLRTHGRLKTILRELGRLYLDDGPSLIHGDFFPGSWLQSNGNLCVIDPEFSYCGRPEFDLGVMRAHLGLLRGQVEVLPAIQRAYGAAANSLDWQLVEMWAAAEVLRRLCGVAQLPLTHSLDERTVLIERCVSQLLKA